jgi:hypothetical protein
MIKKLRSQPYAEKWEQRGRKKNYLFLIKHCSLKTYGEWNWAGVFMPQLFTPEK